MKQGDYGIDIAKLRTDDLDNKMLEYVSRHPGCRVLDLGCGSGGQSSRLVEAGARVIGVDLFDYGSEFEELRKKLNVGREELDFIKGDLRQLNLAIEGKSFEMVSLQRVLHYLVYEEALQVLSYIRSIVSDRLYISVSGLGSELGRGYPGAERGVVERFAILSSDVAEKFSIHEQVCLYNKHELISLLEDVGWSIEAVWVSAFGNAKAVCV